jgi:hypothetical protein
VAKRLADLGVRALAVDLLGQRMEERSHLHDLAVGPAGQTRGLLEPRVLEAAEQLDAGGAPRRRVRGRRAV